MQNAQGKSQGEQLLLEQTIQKIRIRGGIEK